MVEKVNKKRRCKYAEQLKKYPIKEFNDLVLLIKISLIQYKINKLGPMYSEGFDWIEWDDLVDDEAALVSKTYYHREMVKQALAEIEAEYG